jgi:CBS domain-containing protein
MVVGAFSGLAVWRLLEPFAPGVGHSPAPFVVVGMMAVFGGISRAPIAVMLMVAEMTGSIGLLAPAMVAVSIAWFIVGRNDDSIYRSQLRTRDDSPASRLRFGLPLLGTLKVSDVARAPSVTLHDGDLASEALQALADAGLAGAAVVDARGTYLGTVGTERLEKVAAATPGTGIGGAIDTTTATVAASASLDVGLEALVQAGGGWVPVTSEDRRVVGALSAEALLGGYHRALDAYTGYVYNVTSNALAVEETVGRGSPVAGRRVRDAGLPPGCVVVTVQHNGALSYATGSTELAPGDTLSVLVAADQVGQLRDRLRGEDEPPEAEGKQLLV